MIVGIVVGAGIFRIPSDVAAASNSIAGALGLWTLGGLAALLGALCYAELATRHPSIGGEYQYLRLAYGPRIGALFVWARVTVMQTAAIASVAFVAGDYAAGVWPQGPGPALWAGLFILFVTLTNLLGLRAGWQGQRLFVSVELLALFAVMVAAVVLGFGGNEPVMPTTAPRTDISMGLALVFVMLAYGGWNEAAYLSAETRNGSRGLIMALLGGLGLVILLYLAVNAAFLFTLGLDGLAATPAPATLLLERAFGPAAGVIIGIGVVMAALSTMNATVITGARAMCAMGQHVPVFTVLGRWDQARSVPRPALIMQGIVALALTAYGATTRDGFTAMVAFGAPVFWLFLGLTALSLIILRRKMPRASGFSVPLYPFVPLVFLGICGVMLWSSLDYAAFLLTQSEEGRMAGVLGLILLAIGVPLVSRAR